MTHYLYLHQPEVVLRARINMAGTITYPLSFLQYDNVTFGSEVNVKPDMTVLLGSAAGLDNLGRQRVSRGMSAGSLSIGFTGRGVGDGELLVQDNAYITILREYRVWAKIPYIEPVMGTIYKDGNFIPNEEVTSNSVYDPPPCAVAGPASAGTIDPDSGFLRVRFNGLYSFQFVDYVSGNVVGVNDYLWSSDRGVLVSANATSSNVTYDFPPGLSFVTLRVTNSVGLTHETVRPVYARDPDNDETIQDFQIVNRKETAQGSELSLRILRDIPRSTYPDGCMVLLWEDEPQDVDDRSHMIFSGWHQQDEGRTQMVETGNLNETTLHCVNVLGRLKTLPGFSQQIEYVEVALLWSRTRFPQVFYYFWYLLHWHSTVLRVADLSSANQVLNFFEFAIWSSDEDTLFNQVNKLANQVSPDHHFTCNRQGQMLLRVDPLLQEVADRTADVMQNFSSVWAQVSFPYQRAPRVNELITYAFISTTEYEDVDGVAMLPTAVSRAPGGGYGQGEGRMERTQQIVESQGHLNACEGQRYARLNAPYGRVSVTLPMALLQRDVDPAYLTWVQLSLDESQAPPRADLTTVVRALVHEIAWQYEYDEGGVTGMVTLTLELETSGPPALTYNPP